MANWQRSPDGYFAVIEKPMPTTAAKALESNENFQKGEVFQRDEPAGTPERAPQTLQFNVSIGLPLFAQFERKFHAELRGVKLNDRLDRLQALIDAAPTDPAIAAQYNELVETALFGASA